MTMASWVGAQLRPDAPGFWLALDLLVAAALWMLPVRYGRRETLARPLRWIVLPSMALLAGALSPQALGLAGIDWQAGITLGLGIVLGLLLLLALVRLTVREPAGDPQEAAGSAASLYALLYGGAQQFHWCFQRGALLALFVSLAALPAAAMRAPVYWATWVAVLIALPGLLFVAPGLPRLYTGIALVATAILFFYTRNFWLCWALHSGILAFAGVAWLRPELKPAATPQRTGVKDARKR
jgi:hypothetical protein